MSTRTAPVLAWTICATSLVISGLALVLPELRGGGTHLLGLHVAIELIIAEYLLLAGFLASRRPANPIGWMSLLFGSLLALGQASNEYAFQGLLVAPGSLPAAGFVAWLSPLYLPTALFMVAPLIFLLYPTGRPPSPRWWALGYLIIAVVVLANVVQQLGPPFIYSTEGSNRVLMVNPTHVSAAWVASAYRFLNPLATAMPFLAAVSLVVRFRRATDIERHQLKWLAYPAGLMLAIFVVCFPFAIAYNSGVAKMIAWFSIVVAIGFFLPFASTVAILRYRLYDIDVVINRSLVFGALALFIGAVYVGIVAGLGSLIGTARRPNLLLSIVATAVVAVAFQPVRQRIERVANRLVYGKRATPYEVLSEFSAKVAGSYAGEEILPRMAQVLAEGTGAVQAAVWIRSGSQDTPVASYPPPFGGEGEAAMEATRVVPVRHEGEVLGALSIRKRPGEAVTPVEEGLLHDLAAQAGLVLRNVHLTAELQARLEQISAQADELRASRQRIVAAQDAERRRLERNIHDGAQQHLVALTVKLRLAAAQVKKDPVHARQTVMALEGETEEALQTLRDLARGIYPPTLREQGLVAALQAHASRMDVPLDLRPDGVARYPADLEAAVYFSCLEALQNVAKHAGARHVHVDLAEEDGTLRFSVSDDGRGFEPEATTQGAGLQNMADRIEALGGSLTVSASPGRGTTVIGRVPARAMEPAS